MKVTIYLTVIALALFNAGQARAEVKQTAIVASQDVQFRINNTGQNGVAATYEIRHSGDNNWDYGFVAALKFDLNTLKSIVDGNGELTNVKLQLTTYRRQSNKNVDIQPFSNDWGEAGGSTDSYAAKQDYITAALAETAIASFYPAVPENYNNYIFERKAAETGESIDVWYSQVDITDYVKTYVSGEEASMSLLLVPGSDNNWQGTLFFSKDANESWAYGNPLGDGSTRWSRIEAFLGGQAEEDLFKLHPKLVVEYEEGNETGIGSASRNENSLNCYTRNGALEITSAEVQEVSIYGIDGRLARKLTLSEGKNGIALSPGVYLINKQKVVVK
jgi:hypothetical protein